jgi:nucleotide-binding universal stress UspA family protein
MRILIAYDGSAGADNAIELVASLPWDAATSVRVVTVVPNAAAIRNAWGRLIVGNPAALEAELAAAAATTLETAHGRLADRALSVEAGVPRGRPAQALAEAAGSWPADLVVVGSRGLGAVGSGLLGSVSAEIVDQSPSPVLVARSGHVGRIILATDGSRQARSSEQFLASLPVARQVPVTVVSVAQVVRAWTAGIAPTMIHEVWRSQAQSEADARTWHAEIAESAASRLRSVGIEAEPEVRAGDPAGEIIAVSGGSDTDLIVVGSRGQTGLRRIVLGSVARKVLYNAPASVLIVRGPGVADRVAAPPAD